MDRGHGDPPSRAQVMGMQYPRGKCGLLLKLLRYNNTVSCLDRVVLIQ